MLLAIPLLFAGCKENNDPTPNKDPKPELTLSKQTLSFSSEGGTQSLLLEANYEWYAQLEFTQEVKWFSIDPVSGPAGKQQTLTVTVTENPLAEERSKSITFVCKEEKEVTLLLTQAAKEEIEIKIPVAERVNTYLVNGQEYAFQSTVLSMVGENPAVFATPQAGLTEWMDIMSSEEYFFMGINPLLNGEKFDMMTEERIFTVMSTLSGAYLETVAPDVLMEILAGEALANYDVENKKMTLQVGLVLVDGTTLAVNIEAESYEEEIVINENMLERGAEQKPVRAAFYMPEEGMTALYFTPGNISYFDQIYDTTWFFYLMVEDSLMTGQEIDLASLGSAFFMAGVEDNLDPSNSWAISNDDLMGAEGSITIKKLAEEEYLAFADITLDGIRYTLTFSGVVLPYDLVEEKQNIFKYQGISLEIVAGACVMVDDLWLLDLELEDGELLSIEMPASFFDGEPHGFSQDRNFTVSYKDRTFSKSNGDSGTITALVDEVAGIAEVEFTNYDDCEFNYAGPVEIIK